MVTWTGRLPELLIQMKSCPFKVINPQLLTFRNQNSRTTLRRALCSETQRTEVTTLCESFLCIPAQPCQRSTGRRAQTSTNLACLTTAASAKMTECHSHTLTRHQVVLVFCFSVCFFLPCALQRRQTSTFLRPVAPPSRHE